MILLTRFGFKPATRLSPVVLALNRRGHKQRAHPTTGVNFTGLVAFF